MELYERIKYFSSLKGVTPSGMCVDLGISKNIVSNLKQGRVKTLSVKNLSLIANYLDVSVSELLGDDEIIQEQNGDSDLYSRIAFLCEQKGIKIGRMCNDIGVSRGNMGNLKMGRISSLSSDALSKIADYLDVSVDYLLGRTEDAPAADIPQSTGGVWIPVLGRVAAGIPIEAIEYIEDYEEIPQSMAAAGEHFALRIKGDSMTPRINDGDVVIVKRQPDCDNGDIAVVIVNGDEATVKRIKKRPEGLMLIPSNQTYEPMFYNNEEIENLPVRILGKVVELRAKF